MKKKPILIALALMVLAVPLIFFWLKMVGSGETMFASAVIILYFAFSTFFIVYFFSSLIFKKGKNKVIFMTLVFVLGIPLVLYGLSFTDSRATTVSKDCLFEAPIKCGYSEGTEDKILEEINNLGLSKKEAKKSFLKAQKANDERLAELSMISKTRALTREEKDNVIDGEWVVPYYQRALRAVERMSD